MEVSAAGPCHPTAHYRAEPHRSRRRTGQPLCAAALSQWTPFTCHHHAAEPGPALEADQRRGTRCSSLARLFRAWIEHGWYGHSERDLRPLEADRRGWRPIQIFKLCWSEDSHINMAPANRADLL